MVRRTKGRDMKKISSVLILAMMVSLLLVNCDSISYKWVKYHDDNDGNAYFYKKGKVDKDGYKHIVQAWSKEVYSQRGRDAEIESRTKDGLTSKGYRKLSYKKCLYEIDCSRLKISTLSIKRFDTDDKELYSGGTGERNWYDIQPDSPGNRLRQEVCK